MIPAFLSELRVHQLWVHRLGWTLLHFLWQGTVIAVAYALLRRAFGTSFSARGRYVLACAALGAMAAAPPLTFLLIASAPLNGAWAIAEVEWQRLLSVVVALWLAGVVAFSIRVLGGWRVTVRLRSTSHPAPAAWQRTLEQIGARVGARQPVRLLVSSFLKVPAVIGWLRPAILVPVEFLTGLSSVHLSALLAHEMAHIRRHDYFASVLQSIVESVLFYHPAVWWVSEQVRAERELCCDDLAVAATGDLLAYTSALAELESRQLARFMPAVAANGGLLVNRLRRLIEPAHAIADSLPGPGVAWSMTLLWVAGVAFASISSAPLPVRLPVHPVGNILSGHTASPLISLASKARNTLLYDPILSAQPRSRRSAGDGPGNNTRPAPNHNPEHPDVARLDVAHTIMGSERNTGVRLNTSEEGEQKTLQARIVTPAGPEPLPVEEPAPVHQSTGQTSPEGPSAPMFRASTKLVLVDVIARGKRGPAAGLTADAFTLLDNGRPQKIASFAVSSSQTSTPAAFPIPSGAVSNRLGRGGELMANATVLLVDQRNTSQPDQAYAIQQIVKFLRTRRNQYRQPDRLGIYTLDRDGSLRAVQEITDNAELLSRAADTLKPRGPGYINDDRNQIMHLDTREMLEAIARHLASVPGRKGLIWVTAGFSAPAASGPELNEAARALNDADVALYSVDARGLVGALSGTTAISNAEFARAESTGPLSPLTLARQNQAEGGFFSGAMSTLASLTGGLAFYNSNGIGSSIRQALDDAELTYTLGFYPAQEEQDDVWHKLKVEVTTPGVQVHFREKYFASRAPATASDRPTLSELLKVPLDATQIKLVTETAPDQARPGSWQVRTSVDLRDVHLENRNNMLAGAVDVSFLLEGSRTARRITRKIEIPEKQFAAALRAGIVVNDSFAWDGPAGELRVVAQDLATGAAGTVRVPLGNK